MRARPHPGRVRRGVSSLLVLALLVMLSTLAVQATALITGVLGDDSRAVAEARAGEAAAAGLEWGRQRVAVPAVPVCTPVQTLTTLPGTLQPFAVTVRCTPGPVIVDGAASVRRYQLVAVACNLPAGGACPNAAANSPDYVQRTAQWVLHR